MSAVRDLAAEAAASRAKAAARNARRRAANNAAIMAELLKSVVVEGPTEPEPVPVVKEPEPPKPEPSKPTPSPAAPQLPDGLAIPPMTPSVMDRIRDVEHLTAVARAYTDPTITMPAEAGCTRHLRGEIQLIVSQTGTIFALLTNDHGDEEPATPRATPRGLPKAKGGKGGSRMPGSLRELLASLREADYPVERTKGGHWRVETPQGPYIMSSTPSEFRSLRNCVSELRRRGVVI